LKKPVFLRDRFLGSLTIETEQEVKRVKEDGFVVGTHNGECGGEVRKSSGNRHGSMGGGGKRTVMHCSKCDRVVPDSELKESTKGD